MSKRKHGLRLAGLMAVMALGVMAFAASAQAAAPLIVLKDTLGNSVPVLLATFTASQEEPGFLLVPALNLEIKCVKFTVKAGSEILTSTDIDANILFEECKAFELGGSLTELPCHVSDVAGGDATKLHITAAALALPVEFSSGDYGLLFEKIKATANFLSGTGCPLPLKNEFKGEVCSLIEPNTNETAAPLLLFDQAIQTGCPERPTLESLSFGAGVKDKLLYGANEAFIDAKVIAKLSGPHLNYQWGVLLD